MLFCARLGLLPQRSQVPLPTGPPATLPGPPVSLFFDAVGTTKFSDSFSTTAGAGTGPARISTTSGFATRFVDSHAFHSLSFFSLSPELKPLIIKGPRCKSYDCPNRHPRDRTQPCQKGAACSTPGCPLLHLPAPRSVTPKTFFFFLKLSYRPFNSDPNRFQLLSRTKPLQLLRPPHRLR